MSIYAAKSIIIHVSRTTKQILIDYGHQPASNPRAPQLKSKQPYPKQYSKGRVLQQQFPQKMLQLLSDAKMITMSLVSKLPIRN